MSTQTRGNFPINSHPSNNIVIPQHQFYELDDGRFTITLKEDGFYFLEFDKGMTDLVSGKILYDYLDSYLLTKEEFKNLFHFELAEDEHSGEYISLRHSRKTKGTFDFFGYYKGQDEGDSAWKLSGLTQEVRNQIIEECSLR